MGDLAHMSGGHTMLLEGVTHKSETALKDISLQARGLLPGVYQPACSPVSTELPAR